MADDIEVQMPEATELEPLDGDEMKKFDRAWSVLTAVFDENGAIPLFTQADKAGLLTTVRAVKHELLNKPKFGGACPKPTEFGMRWTSEYDVLATTNTEWEVTWATAGDRNWISSAVPDNATFAAATPAKLYDAGQKAWALHIFGVGNYHPSPKVKAFLAEVNTKRFPDQRIEFGQRLGKIKISKFPVPLYVPPRADFVAGLNVRTVGIDSPFPLSLTLGTYERFALTNKTSAYTRCST